jgi:ligand-binding sensor domain-containing protein
MNLLNPILLLSCLAFSGHSQVLAFDRELWTTFANMNEITAIAEGDTHIYIGTTKGIRRYDRFADRWISPLTTLDGLPNNRVRDLAYNSETGDLWIDTFSGSVVWLTRLESISLFAENPPPPHPHISVPPVYLPFSYYLDAPNWIRGPKRSYAITDVHLDTWRILWLGTRGLGVGRADMRTEEMEFHRYGPLDENIDTMVRDGKTIWFGGSQSRSGPSRGISRFHLESGDWTYFESENSFEIFNVQVTSILPDSAFVWFGTHQGLMRYTRKTDQWLKYRVSRRRWGHVTALAKTQNRLWIGTLNGLAIFDQEADSIRTVGGSQRFTIRDLAIGAEYIWAGTDYGLFKCPLGDVTWGPAESESSILKMPVNGLLANRSGVWATLESPSALIYLPANGGDVQRHPFPEVSGDRHIGIAADSSAVWLATDMGGFRFDIRRKQFRRYSTADGLIGEQVNSVLLEGDYVWFGTTRGASRYQWKLDFFDSNH